MVRTGKGQSLRAEALASLRRVTSLHVRAASAPAAAGSETSEADVQVATASQRLVKEAEVLTVSVAPDLLLLL